MRVESQGRDSICRTLACYGEVKNLIYSSYNQRILKTLAKGDTICFLFPKDPSGCSKEIVKKAIRPVMKHFQIKG